MSTTPELGFEYFPSPEKGDNEERISYLLQYFCAAVKEWPRARRRLIKAQLKSAELDHIEAHVISVFREARDVMLWAIETDNLGSMSEPRLLERVSHAFALLALSADSGSMPAYRDMIIPPSGGDAAGRPDQADFNKSIWDAAWDTQEGRMPVDITRERVRGHRREREMDGLYNRHRRRDCVANAGLLEEYDTEGPKLLLKEKSELIERAIESLILQLRDVAKQARLKPAHIEFLVEMAVHGRQQKDNPTAWRAIRDRKRAVLYPEILRLVDVIRKRREEFLLI